MSKSTVLPAALALAMFAGLAPVQAETTAVPTAPTMGIVTKGDHSVSGLNDAQLAQLAGAAGVSVSQARGMTLSQLYFLKEGRDSDTPDVWKGQVPVSY